LTADLFFTLCDNSSVSLSQDKTQKLIENTCTRKAVSIIALTCSSSRSSKLPFLTYHSKLENVAVFFVFVPLVCSKSELVKNFQL
jgi:hypothetical protein